MALICLPRTYLSSFAQHCTLCLSLCHILIFKVCSGGWCQKVNKIFSTEVCSKQDEFEVVIAVSKLHIVLIGNLKYRTRLIVVVLFYRNVRHPSRCFFIHKKERKNIQTQKYSIPFVVLCVHKKRVIHWVHILGKKFKFKKIFWSI